MNIFRFENIWTLHSYIHIFIQWIKAVLDTFRYSLDSDENIQENGNSDNFCWVKTGLQSKFQLHRLHLFTFTICLCWGGRSIIFQGMIRLIRLRSAHASI